MKTARCKSCDAEIIWTISNVSGANMPMDAQPLTELASTRGLFVLVKRLDDAPLAWPISPDRDGLATFQTRRVALYQSHFASCPDARTHRRAA